MVAGRMLLAVSSFAAVFLVCATASLAATPATQYDFLRFSAVDPQTNGRFGDRMKDAGDLDGDGAGDVWIGVYDRDIGNLPNVGRVYALSGRSRSVLYQIDSPEPQGCSGVGFCGFGWSVSNLGDVDGDRVTDLVVGSVRHNATATGDPCAPSAPGCNAQQGKAWVFSGAPGKQDKPLYELNNPQPQAFGAFGWASTAGDVIGANGLPGRDGISEILVGAFQNDFPTPGCGNPEPVVAPCRKDQGQAFIFNGAPGLTAAQRLAQVRTLNVPPEDRYVDANGVCTSPVTAPTGQRCGALGIVAEGVGDVNNDGFWDQSVTAWTTGIPKPPAVDGPPCLGVHPSTPDDVCNERQGRIYIYSGRDGSLLRKVDNPEPQQDALLGLQIVEAGAPGDVDGDGHDDIYANGFTQHGPRFPDVAANTEGQSWVMSGRTGSVLYKLNDPTPERGGQFGYSLAKTDYNEDGRPDLYVGSSPHHEPGTQQSGGTYVFNGPNGALLKIFDLPPPDVQPGVSAADTGPQLGRSVAAPGDLNGDGDEDYIAGAPTINTAAHVNEGRLYFFLSQTGPAGTPTAPGPPPFAPFAGCPNLTANVIRGSAAGGRITGTVSGDRIFGGTGNDVVDGLAGDDCIDLGPGTDTGQGGLGNDLILGGLGADQMAGSSGDDAVRGGPSGDRVDGGFGNDRLHGQSGGDRLSGSRGRDRINGGSSNDVISGGSSNDRVAGDQGNDRINGNSANDVLRGNSGNDRIKGSTGKDRISGGGGKDRIDARDGRGGDRIACGIGRDSVVADRRDRVGRDCERVRRRR